VSGNVVSYEGAPIGVLAGGTSGAEPLFVTFNPNATPEAAQALLRDVTYMNVSHTPSTLARTIRASLTAPDGSVWSQATMTISVQGVPVDPVLAWSRPADIVYGTALSSLQLNPSANVPGTFVFDPPIGRVLLAGNDQVLTAAFTPDDTNNYTSVTISNRITAGKALLVIRAEDKVKVYGQTNPPLTASYSGLVNGDTATELDTPVSLSTTATTSSPVGAYPIIDAGATDADYEITFIEGVLTVEPNAQVASIAIEAGGLIRIRFTGLSGGPY